MPERPSAIVVSGTASALSVVRSLAKRGIRVYAINQANAHVKYSRHCEFLDVPGGRPADWAAYLLGPKGRELAGSVLLTCSDEAIEMVIDNHQALSERFLLEENPPEVRRLFLSKLDTYECAAAAGVATPRFWRVAKPSRAVIDEVRDQLVFPLLVKPHHSHVFQERFDVRFFVARTVDELASALDRVQPTGIPVVLLEFIPGPDDRLCSYYSYFDEHHQPLLDFTKRIIRRYPQNMGGASYHITDWNPAVREVGIKLFQAAGLRGLGNVEFKRDPRDETLKLIEVNARFTAANRLVHASGIDLAYLSYARLTGAPLPPLDHYRTGLRLLNIHQDFNAFLELRAAGSLSTASWLASVLRPQVMQYFAWSDPVPSTMFTLWRSKEFLVRQVERLKSPQG
ncbi:MAG: hypothetical protein Tsb0020_51660 [Haliangiales bacterium]